MHRYREVVEQLRLMAALFEAMADVISQHGAYLDARDDIDARETACVPCRPPCGLCDRAVRCDDCPAS